MQTATGSFGVLDNRFLARSLGLLNPEPALVLEESEPIRLAIELLQANKQGCVVITNEHDCVVGIFSERDAVIKVMLAELPVNSTPVSEVMTPNPQTAKMTTTVAFALNMMSQGGYRHIPIVDDKNHPVGVITVKNLVDYISHTVTKDLSRF